MHAVVEDVEPAVAAKTKNVVALHYGARTDSDAGAGGGSCAGDAAGGGGGGGGANAALLLLPRRHLPHETR